MVVQGNSADEDPKPREDLAPWRKPQAGWGARCEVGTSGIRPQVSEACRFYKTQGKQCMFPSLLATVEKAVSNNGV